MNRLLVLSSLALSLSCGAAFAQQSTDPQQAPASQTESGSADASMHHGHHRPNPHRQAEMLSRRLSLNPDQTSKIEPILAARDQQMQALHSNSQLPPDELHAQKRSINQTAEQAMAGVLTPDQLTQLKQMRHHHHMHHDGNGDTPQSPTA